MQDVNNVIQGSESAFSADEYAQRIRRTRERLSRAGVDVMIVTARKTFSGSPVSKHRAITPSRRCCCR